MGGGNGGNARVLVTVAVLLCAIWSGCTTQEGDINVFVPGPDGSVPTGECVPGITGICSGYGGLGQCTNGVKLCGPDGTWGHCIGEGLPSGEVCDAVDNDCDGQIDDHIDCNCSDEVEVCDDRRDNNCNGQVDEGCSCDPGVTEPCITDLPGACAYGTMRCRPDGVSFTECLPTARESAETCDGVDNDCDGIADEDVCECSAGSSRGCLTGLPGACRTGTQTCSAAGRGFGPCLPTVTESDEVCDDGVDNDCDGTADEGCDCTTGATRACVTSLPGECAAGLQTCTASVWGHCLPDLGASPEACDGLDNDCDGLADEEVCSCTPGDVQTCHSGLPGACDIGEQTCTADGRGYGTCLSLNVPSAERCNGIDDDCDGVADDDGVCSCTSGATRNCPTGTPGACSVGTQTCADGGRGYTPCLPTTAPTGERCDGIDNDCDGIADEEVCACTPLSTRPCAGDAPGQCRAGTQACDATGRGWGACLSTSGPTSETCDGIDNDCDGEADEEVCTCTPFDIRLCPTGFPGECADGLQFCSADGRGWSPCEPFVWPWMAFPDVCGDGVDSDCDGTADEGCTCAPGDVIACVSALPGRCSAGTRTCTADGTMYGDCIPASGSAAETCNGVDDDCDGVADEEVCDCTPFSTRACLSGLGGVCAAGEQACDADGRGWSPCLPTTGPTPDACADGLDSDCDGTADEGCDCAPGTSRTCVTTLPGACSAGTQSCTDGLEWGPCVPAAAPAAETCDGIDNDCDGPSDEEVCTCTSGATAGCLTGLPGACSAGITTCTGGRGFTACLPTRAGSAEVCDGIDNDCDGTADEDVCSCTAGETRACLTGLAGRCAAGTETCRMDGRGFNGCVGANAPIAETCNGVDDDCDGVADEEVCTCTPLTVRACPSGAPGACAIGSQTCAGDGRGWSPCLSTTGPTPDTCADGIDNDCDGTADEGCSCTPGLIRGCVTGIAGACSGGSQTCDAAGRWAPCLPAIAPAAEACNGIDDDCDGSADEDGICTCSAGTPASCLTGLAGICAGGTMTCTSGGRGFTACLPSLSGTVETCNGLDDDCDGVADEGVCACAPGATRGCDTGIPGICGAGVQTCDLSGAGWGPCLTTAVRSADGCGDGLDTDCDGTADEDCVCTSGTSRPCTSGLDGACSAGLQACTGGRWDLCIPTGVATLEVCNGRDDDCDGVADEEVCACTPLALRACVTSLPGICAAGTQRCDADGRGFGPCTPTSAPTVDACTDGLDNDCDGTADEGCTCTAGLVRTCDTGRLGVCAAGTQACAADGRSWNPCLPSAGPSSEICDGSDNDCDGLADEEVCTCIASTTRGCITPLPGVCAAGLQACSADGSGWGTCLPTTAPTPDTCGDGLDSDCDGTADEGCTCTAGATRSCLTGIPGVCSTGLQTCAAGLTWGPCLPTIAPSSDTCNGVDDDCDGPADEDGVCSCAPGAAMGCLTGLPGVCSAGIMTCTAGGRGFTACLPTIAPSGETCNGLDDDCDGTADEGGVCTCVAGTTEACTTGLAGACGAGTHTCRSDGRGYGPCVGAAGPTPETCDGVDNDCDGNADEEVCTCTGGITRGCPTGLPGVCAAGTQTCDADGRGWSHCTSLAGPSADTCGDGLDSDCDGTADEGCVCTSGASRACTTGLDGTCAIGSQTCTGGRWDPCVPTVAPLPETCPGDGLDSDCDGRADEGCDCVPGASESCLTGLLGLCTMGSMTCRPDGRFGACLPVSGPVSEILGNGTDDDCNGVTDDVASCVAATTVACATGMPGACAAGVQTCLPSGSGYGPCVPTTFGSAETCTDGLDNNCDGRVNEGCACTPGAGLSCSTGMFGSCAAGTTTCLGDGTGYGPCVPGAFPVPEVCNDRDDDCNGFIDNGLFFCP